MKLEVGQFARLKSGYICKIININDFREPNMKYGVDANYLKDVMFIGYDDVIKASYSITDILEKGDYVNGCKVIDIVENDIYISNFYAEQCIDIVTIKNIKSIVTKEQMEQMAYKVGE